MVCEFPSQSFEEYFWRDVDWGDKVILDAGNGFGLTTSEVARRIAVLKPRSRIISVDIDPSSFQLSRKRLQKKGC